MEALADSQSNHTSVRNEKKKKKIEMLLYFFLFEDETSGYQQY